MVKVVMGRSVWRVAVGVGVWDGRRVGVGVCGSGEEVGARLQDADKRERNMIRIKKDLYI
jgi:hypothetical protein